MNLDFTSKVTLSKKNIYFNELKVKHLKSIYKCLLGEDLNAEIIFVNLNNILKKITSLNREEIEKLNFLDYFLLLFEIRCTSIGNLIYTQSTDNDNTKIEINIYKFINLLNDQNVKNILKSNYIDDIQVHYTLPTIHDILFTNFLDQTYLYFIKEIIFNKKNINFLNLTKEEKNKILEKIPAKITSHIFQKAFKITNTFNKLNLLSTTFGLKDKVLPFNFKTENLTSIIKILFGEQLMTLYENIFMLCKIGNFTPEYIENCTPGEYILFVKKLNAFVNQQNKSNNNYMFNENFKPINNDLE